MLNLDYNQFSGGFSTAPNPTSLLLVDVSNNLLAASYPPVSTPTDFSIRFEPLDAAMGTSLAFYADNNAFSGAFPEALIQHIEVTNCCLSIAHVSPPLSQVHSSFPL